VALVSCYFVLVAPVSFGPDSGAVDLVVPVSFVYISGAFDLFSLVVSLAVGLVVCLVASLVVGLVGDQSDSEK
jgi:hypothetical protein